MNPVYDGRMGWGGEGEFVTPHRSLTSVRLSARHRPVRLRTSFVCRVASAPLTVIGRSIVCTQSSQVPSARSAGAEASLGSSGTGLTW